ncbi:MAG: hypothetical protein JJ939_11485 [Alphaproteobacteria bacterium]|nr:hypothetical protein [Alphaproteobacteria bacterium]MBO6629037.1 hypothetical protein [Alphaproteobacteria bacterium]
MSQPSRWLAVVTYRTDSGLVTVEHDIEELEEIQDLVEAGPSWFAISGIKITLQRDLGYERLTIEQAEAL